LVLSFGHYFPFFFIKLHFPCYLFSVPKLYKKGKKFVRLSL
jgi:hypothetical protein